MNKQLKNLLILSLSVIFSGCTLVVPDSSKKNETATSSPLTVTQHVSNGEITDITCDKNLNSLPQNNNIGISFAVNCPKNCSDFNSDYNVWGTDTYTVDSSICTAAAHAGVIESSNGGIVYITVTKSLPSYVGSERNNIKTKDWPSSFGNTAFTVATGMSGTPTSGQGNTVTTPPVQGTSAPVNQPGQIVLGEYACYGVGTRLMAGMGFILNAGGNYNDVDGGRSGNYLYNSQAASISFQGGFLDGQTGSGVTQAGFDLSSTVNCEPW